MGPATKKTIQMKREGMEKERKKDGKILVWPRYPSWEEPEPESLENWTQTTRFARNIAIEKHKKSITARKMMQEHMPELLAMLQYAERR